MPGLRRDARGRSRGGSRSWNFGEDGLVGGFVLGVLKGLGDGMRLEMDGARAGDVMRWDVSLTRRRRRAGHSRG